jgi:hypothetical protein
MEQKCGVNTFFFVATTLARSLVKSKPNRSLFSGRDFPSCFVNVLSPCIWCLGFAFTFVAGVCCGSCSLRLRTRLCPYDRSAFILTLPLYTPSSSLPYIRSLLHLSLPLFLPLSTYTHNFQTHQYFAQNCLRIPILYISFTENNTCTTTSYVKNWHYNGKRKESQAMSRVSCSPALLRYVTRTLTISGRLLFRKHHLSTNPKVGSCNYQESSKT